MENSNLLGSESPSTTQSPSPPSPEPLDIRKLFASYAYESPVLDTSDGFGDSICKESEGLFIQENTRGENHVNELKKTRCKYELGFVSGKTNPIEFANKHENQSLSEIPDSSPLLISEPPDIRNWFESYAYESFVLDSNDEVKESLSQESELEKEEFIMEEKQKEREENVDAFRETRNRGEFGVNQGICLDGFAKCNGSFGDDGHENKALSEVSDSLDSPPFLTEPPDAENLLSSYVCETPQLDTSDLYLEREIENDELVVEDSDEEKEERPVIIRKVSRDEEVVDVQKVHSHGFVKHNSYFGVNEQDNEYIISKSIDEIEGKKNPSSHHNLCSDSNDLNPSTNVQESSLNDEGSNMSTLVQEPSQEACTTMPWKINRKKSPAKLFYRTDFEANMKTEDVHLVSSPTSKSKVAAISGASLRKQSHGSDDKENEQKENGFVSTRKNGSTITGNQDSLKKRPKGILLESSRNKETVSVTDKSNVVVKRMRLMDTTNLQHSDPVEVAGKWRCPQRRKTELDPLMRQTGIGQFFRKV